jgi:hypothetical protein
MPPRTREPPPRQDVPGQSMLFPDCPPHPAGPPDASPAGIYSYHGLRLPSRAFADARRTEALRKRDERREAKQ